MTDSLSHKNCHTNHHLELTAPSGYLSSLAAETMRIGTRECPWILKAKKGQQIKLTLMDFSVGSETGATAIKTQGKALAIKVK